MLGRRRRSEYGVRWLEARETPWGVPVLDVRPVTQTMVSTSTDPQMAANAASWGGDTGQQFAEMRPEVDRVASVTLRYRVDRLLADGVLFSPAAMEHKWALFFHRQRVLFVRSWTRKLMVAATTRVSDGKLEITSVAGAFEDPPEPVAQTASIDR